MPDAEWCHQLKYDISCTASEISSLTNLPGNPQALHTKKAITSHQAKRKIVVASRHVITLQKKDLDNIYRTPYDFMYN